MAVVAAEPVKLSGIYPHLTMFNNEGECGTGAVVPFADRLWVATYAPHQPTGSSDKLYEITPDLQQIIRPESIGGTPANRMIHKESNQLFISSYAIDANRNVRTIPFSKMFGRMTGNARHLTDPAGKIYYATMEEGIYEVDVKTLEVTELWRDEKKKGTDTVRKADLPGYHGKGLYSGQGKLIYANNGEYGSAAQSRPDVPSGALAEWDGKADKWTLIRRNQFTEVTGPGGITGNADAANDPVWTVGWDYRSLILMCLYEGKWTSYRLPKGSHSYDGAHGWNTEWPRIREIDEDNFLMTMHGTFWKFPKTFTPKNSAGIVPRSNYLKVIGDFVKWKDQIVFGCDDTANAEFLNSRKAKGKIAAPQSQSNLWFVEPSTLDKIGPVIGRGAVWAKEDVAADVASDPFLFSGYDHRGLHLSHGGSADVVVELEVDKKGDGTWSPLVKLTVPAGKELFHSFTADESGVWVRLKSSAAIKNANAVFTYRNKDARADKNDDLFTGIAKPGEKLVTGGQLRARAGGLKDLAFAAVAPDGTDIGFYLLDDKLKLVRSDNAAEYTKQKETTAIPKNVLSFDEASVIFTDDDGKRWRLPKGDAAFENGGTFGNYRVAREVATERDLFNAAGTFYELPARNAGGFSRVRPVATHNLMVHDFCSYRGLFVASGVSPDESLKSEHIIRSDDGKAAVWAGAVDDLWKLGKPRGEGGPWLNTPVKAGEASDPYLMTAYDKKSLNLGASSDVTVTIEVDIAGDGSWVTYSKVPLKAGVNFAEAFPDAFSAYWIRFTSDKDAKVSAQLSYH